MKKYKHLYAVFYMSKHVNKINLLVLTTGLRPKFLVPVVAVPLWQHQREEKVKYDLAVVHGVPGNVRHKPVPELSQGSAQKNR